jgi:hypothetical protein
MQRKKRKEPGVTTETTENLIARLSAQAAPVKRLRPPMLRAGLWLLAAALGSTFLIAIAADTHAFMARAHDARQKIELAATLATGILAVLAAFELSLPDRSRAWAWLPMPALAVWLATTGLGCLKAWTAGTSTDLSESAECFAILIGTSLPLGLVLSWMLLKAKPMAPIPVAAMGGLGVAAISAFLLQFFHPFDVTIMDLAIHAIAIALVVGVSALASHKGAPA